MVNFLRIDVDQRVDKPGYDKQYYKLLKETRPEHLMYLRVRSHSKQRGIEFALEESDIFIPKICPIMQIPIEFTKTKVSMSSPSLDRIDNNKGYIKGNVRVISLKANSIKSDLTLETAERLLAYMKGQL